MLTSGIKSKRQSQPLRPIFLNAMYLKKNDKTKKDNKINPAGPILLIIGRFLIGN
tara:strand:+ start:105 stop:269 length:165 start_codon:yes stop_codon:yes gene_type:complete